MAPPSIFEKWFGKKGKPFISYEEKRRFTRISLEPKESVCLHLLNPTVNDSGETLIAHVLNVSMRGCQLIFDNKTDAEKLGAGDTFVASLAVDDFPIPLSVQVVRSIGEREAAIEFKPPFPRELERLEKFLEPRCLGLSMREIDSKFLQGSEKKGLAWFQGANDTHLFCWFDPDTHEIIQQQLVFLQSVVEWGRDTALRTGKIRKESENLGESYGWVKAELLDLDHVVNPAVIKTARMILEASSINAQVREKFLSVLKG